MDGVRNSEYFLILFSVMFYQLHIKTRSDLQIPVKAPANAVGELEITSLDQELR